MLVQKLNPLLIDTSPPYFPDPAKMYLAVLMEMHRLFPRGVIIPALLVMELWKVSWITAVKALTEIEVNPSEPIMIMLFDHSNKERRVQLEDFFIHLHDLTLTEFMRADFERALQYFDNYLEYADVSDRTWDDSKINNIQRT